MGNPIATCLWFSGDPEAAVNYYLSIFKDSRIVAIDRFSNAGPDFNSQVVFIEFELNGHPFQALNGGPESPFPETISFSIACENQEEIDYYWNALTADGGTEVQCGWLKDKYGISWQIVSTRLNEMLRDPDRERSTRVMHRFMEQKKIVIAELEAAWAE